MRTFVITRPGLSFGRPGTHVTALQLRMDDDKLDAFVEAGYAIEVHGEASDPPSDDIPDTLLDDLGVLVDDQGEPMVVPDAQPGDELGAPIKPKKSAASKP